MTTSNFFHPSAGVNKNRRMTGGFNTKEAMSMDHQEKKIIPYNVRLGVSDHAELQAVAEFHGVPPTTLFREWMRERLREEVSKLRRAAEKLDQVERARP